ncbi:unnamed protein product [Ilex paraguariensis]|uniref:Uncharacterized protein n=1 Tax=Ilex paraguariensis TaxID=185542 RepID=A0ABC8V5B3_9AQUA
MIEEIIDTEEDLLKIKILDEIVTTKEEEQMIGDTILFPQLEEISLANLENLNCFCSGNCEFQFPSLNKLEISGCPNMKTFSSGPLSTGKLGEGNISIGGQEFWMGDLNTTIQNASELLKQKIIMNKMKMMMMTKQIEAAEDDEDDERVKQIERDDE